MIVSGSLLQAPVTGAKSGIRAEQNAKQNAKRAETDARLAKMIAVWPDLPEAAKTVILATVKAYVEEQAG